MGHISREHYAEEFYQHVKRQALPPGTPTVLIFVANDVDALCACKMLLSLLKADCIAHKVIPVAGYTDLSFANEDLIDGNEELRSIVLLNCGGLVDLGEFLSLGDEMTVFVVDSHRPINLRNFFGNDQIYVLDDGDIEELDEVKRAFDTLEYEFDSESDESDSESESDSDDDDNDPDDDDVRAQLKQHDDADDDDIFKNVDVSERGASSSRKRKKRNNDDGAKSDFEQAEVADGDSDDGGDSDDNTNSVQDDDDDKLKGDHRKKRRRSSASPPPPDELFIHEEGVDPAGEDATRGADTDGPKPSSSKNRKNDSGLVNNDDDNQNVGGSSRRESKRERRRRKREKRYERREQRKRELRECQRIIAEYYAEGTYYGTSVSTLLYNVTCQLGRASNDSLWWAILGVTEQYLHDRLDFETYCLQAELFKEEVARFNVMNPSSSTRDRETANGRDLDDLSLLNGSAGGGGGIGGLAGTITRTADDRTIRCEDEFRLMLLRHWSLYESMFHSSYVATKLGIWKEKGRQNLVNLLVKMGFPLDEARQLYTEMHIDFKKRMNTKLRSVAPKYNMHEIVFPSFVRHFGYKTILSASDA
ncbi:hypothetical protein HK102_012141, partial [Quaeritorhiza haematococci]